MISWSRCLHLRFLVLAALLVPLSGCSMPNKDSCKWVFSRTDGQSMTGICSIADCESEIKPWSEATREATGTLHVSYPDGTVYQERGYANGRLSGAFRVWFPNGGMSQDVQYTNGVRHGLMTLWHANGQRASQATYHDGKLEGIYHEWHPDGRPQRETRYSRGVLDGRARSWNLAGDAVEDGVWRNMQPWDGRLTLYQRTGEPPVVGVYSNGVLIEKFPVPSKTP